MPVCIPHKGTLNGCVLIQGSRGTVGLEVVEQLYIHYLFLFPPVASAPTYLTAVQEGPTGIRVSWTPPTPLGDTTGYRIYYSGGSSGSVNVGGGSTDNHLLTGLLSGTSYNISIVATSNHFFSDLVEYPNDITLSELLQWRSTGACAMIRSVLPTNEACNYVSGQLCSRMTNDVYPPWMPVSLTFMLLQLDFHYVCHAPVNPRRACGIGLLQLSCVSVCLSVSLSAGANLRTGRSRHLTEGTSGLSST